MQRAILTVGLGFGDEGKGATIDYLTRHFDADLVIRYCGGSQAGHNVELPDGRRHTFSQFGAGTLADQQPRTYLGPNVIIDPVALSREGQHLVELGVKNPFGLLTIHPSCLVSTSWQQLLNRVRELARGSSRHGSCGQGIGETRKYWLQNGKDAIVAADLLEMDQLRDKLELLRQRTLLELQSIVEQIPAQLLDDFDLWKMDTETEARRLHFALSVDVTLSSRVPECEMALIEGAQGVLLDEYCGFHPHTTWSTVTLQHAWELVEQMQVDALTVLGLTRGYTTRHGQGQFPTYSAALTERLPDPGNPVNPWQCNFRCGWLDLPLLRYAIACVGHLDGLVVNHLDEVQPGDFFYCPEYEGPAPVPAVVPNLGWQGCLTERLHRSRPKLLPTSQGGLLETLDGVRPVVLTSRGPTYRHRNLAGLHFRKRPDWVSSRNGVNSRTSGSSTTTVVSSCEQTISC